MNKMPSNPAMVMDLYELTMANGYYLDEESRDTRVAFDVFFRRNPDQGGFSVFAGLEQIVDYLDTLHFEKEDVDYLRSLQQFDERFLRYLEDFRTEILAQFNHQSLIATKARRIVQAAGGRAVSDFGARRAHGNDAAVYGARACFIGGVKGTATVLAGQRFDIPVSGTMAHSWVMLYEDELTAFRRFAERYPHNCILLVDTYDVLNSGMPNAIKVFREMREQGIRSRSYGIRIDSGDLAYLTKKARAMLDEAGFQDAKIIISNSLDEYTITSILDQGGQVNAFGVGERMITSRSEPVFGGVYKLCAVNRNGVWEPRIKVSDTVEKTTNPGLKDVYRIYDAHGRAVADLICMQGEEVDRGPAAPLEAHVPGKLHGQKAAGPGAEGRPPLL